MISARDALGLATEVLGVVSASANCYARSLAAKRAIATESADTIADGMAVRVPVSAALDVIMRGAARIVEVTDAEVEEAIRALFSDTHQVAEGSGAAPLAALLKDPTNRRKICRRAVRREHRPGALARILSAGWS